MKDYCRRCWLDFLTSDEGLDLSYLDKVEPVGSKNKLDLTIKQIYADFEGE